MAGFAPSRSHTHAGLLTVPTVHALLSIHSVSSGPWCVYHANQAEAPKGRAPQGLLDKERCRMKAKSFKWQKDDLQISHSDKKD